MVTQIYGDILYYSPSSDTMAELPSPESLKKRIVVSTKPPKEYLDTTKSMIKDDGSVNMKISTDKVTWGEELSEHLEIQQSTDEVGKLIKIVIYINQEYKIFKSI